MAAPALPIEMMAPTHIHRSAPVGDPLLVCRVQSMLAAIPLGYVIETMRPLPLRPMAQMPMYVRGLAVVRGGPVPVIDLARLLEAGQGEPPASRWVVVRSGERRVAVAVEEVVGLRRLARDQLHAVPSLLREVSAELVAAIGVLDAELLVVLRSTSLLPSTVWEAMKAQDCQLA